jgi:hypothetical protein
MVRIDRLIMVMFALFILGCNQPTTTISTPANESGQIEKEAILKTLINETRAASARNYRTWQTHWVHRPSVSKTYMNFAGTSFSEMNSWEEIDDFVKKYMEEHPDPVPPPAPPENVHIELYGNGAWVSYEMLDEVFGNKRETRLMEKANGQWKIASMHTSIYGFNKR